MKGFCELARDGYYLIDHQFSLTAEMHYLPITEEIAAQSGLFVKMDPFELKLAQVRFSCTRYGDLWTACATVLTAVVGEIRFYEHHEMKRQDPLRIVEQWVNSDPRTRFIWGSVYEDVSSILEDNPNHLTGSALVRGTCIYT